MSNDQKIGNRQREPKAETTSAFTLGGDLSAFRPDAAQQQRLGPSVTSMTSGQASRLDWEREELILAGDLVVQNGWRQIAATDPRVIALLALLQRLPLHRVEDRRPDFRNVNSVARKTADIATNRPGHSGRPTNSGAPTKRVIAELVAQPDLMHQLAETIRETEARGDFAPLIQPVPEEDDGASEGRLLVRRHVAYERDRGLRQRKLDEARKAGRPIACEVCGFDFAETYGDRGKDYIECHHIVPLHVSGPGRRRLSDLALLCANCHRMIHARAPWLMPLELQGLIRDVGPLVQPTN